MQRSTRRCLRGFSSLVSSNPDKHTEMQCTAVSQKHMCGWWAGRDSQNYTCAHDRASLPNVDSDALQISFLICVYTQSINSITNDLVPENVWRRSDMLYCLVGPYTPFDM